QIQRIPVWTNEHALNEILSNLVSNAMKHAWRNSGDRAKRIAITINEAPDGYAALAVTDNGVGIESTDLERIFEKGFQSTSEIKADGGHGFGLAIVRALVSRMPGHEIAVESALGVGTTFRIRLPLTEPEP